MEMLKKYWWAIAGVLVLWMTLGKKKTKKRRRPRRYNFVPARRMYGAYRRMRTGRKNMTRGRRNRGY